MYFVVSRCTAHTHTHNTALTGVLEVPDDKSWLSWAQLDD